MRRVIFVLFLAVLVMTGCHQKRDTIRIGVAQVLSGPDTQLGTFATEGIQIATDEWNEKGGVLGKKIELIIRDDEAKPNQAVAVAQELVSQRVPVVVGHSNSGCTIPASNIYAQNNILQITAVSTNPQVTERGIKMIFRMCGRDDQQGVIAAEFAAKKLGLKKVALLHNKTAYGQGIAEEFKKTFESLGGTASLTGMAEEERDFRANITALKSEGAEGIFWGGMYAQGGPLVNQLRQAGLDIPFICGDGCYGQEFINTVGTQAKNVYVTFSPDFESAPSAQSFLKRFRAKFHELGPYAINGYEAMNVVLKAIQETGSTDAGELASYLKSHEFDTLMGKIEFDEKGDLKKSIFVVWTIENGKFVVVP